MKREYGVTDVARILNVARSTVIYWIKDGRLNGHQLAKGHNRVLHEDLVDFMNKNSMPLDLINNTMNKRVLLVDDDLSLLKIMTSALTRSDNITVHSTSFGFEAGLLTGTFRPHVVVLDIGLEDIDGREVCASIRKNPELSEIKILGISGLISEEEEKSILNWGFDNYMSKPFTVDDFTKEVTNLFKHTRTRRHPFSRPRPKTTEA